MFRLSLKFVFASEIKELFFFFFFSVQLPVKKGKKMHLLLIHFSIFITGFIGNFTLGFWEN